MVESLGTGTQIQDNSRPALICC